MRITTLFQKALPGLRGGAAFTLLLSALAVACVSGPWNKRIHAAQQSSDLAPHNPPPASAYAGDAACLGCHQQVAESYVHTAHHLTSQAASTESIHGSFSAGANTLKTSNPRLTFEMRQMPDGSFTETADYRTQTGNLQTLTQPIEIVTGSGRKGQTYLYWVGDLLFELPVSYWAANGTWINSPGYKEGTAHFDRPVIPQCLECHASYFESQTPQVNRFNKTELVLGVGCERCHGPAAEHVRREQQSQQTHTRPVAEAIINPAKLTRERQIDVCALCHAGAGLLPAPAPALSFQPGDVLAEYVKAAPIDPDQPLDVHTNQVQLLRQSKCFRSSEMTCTTCHNTHEEQRDAAAFSSKCLGCHSIKACPTYKEQHEAIQTRCVECHMPLQQSKTLFSDNLGEHLTPAVRNHRIAIYPKTQ
ncbi:multiheme c-type cytochrome [Acidicapsa ligni]|uniref:multiheme c-type cytochrome n=1 Tax=Acidicapsa ligni TaxID=542300 RepID=UPI0021DF92CF|nr:multiheme c-type cytochrome [Acidicapsa ligni]